MQTPSPRSQVPTREIPAIVMSPGERPLEEQYPARNPEGPPDVQPDTELPRVASQTIVPPVNPNKPASPTYPDGDGLEHTKTDDPPHDRQGIDGNGNWSK